MRRRLLRLVHHRLRRVLRVDMKLMLVWLIRAPLVSTAQRVAGGAASERRKPWGSPVLRLAPTLGRCPLAVMAYSGASERAGPTPAARRRGRASASGEPDQGC